MKKRQQVNKIVLIIFFFITGQNLLAQELWKHFTADDFTARREALMEKIPDGVAIFVAAEMPEAFVKFRQDNNFYYLTGVEIPDAVLWLNGKTKKSTLFIPDEIPGEIKKEARIEANAEDAKRYKFDSVLSKDRLLYWIWHIQYENEILYLNMAPPEMAEMSRDGSFITRDKRIKDPLDGRFSREAALANRIRERFPAIHLKNIAKVIDEMRWVKDDKEIALLRECGRIGALGYNEALKIIRPGIYEYQVAAACDFYYQYNGAQNPAFFPIAASGERALDWHYSANSHKLVDGEVFLLDFAPDLDYYVTDITRTWPINGKFTAEQLKFYNCIKDARAQVIKAIKPGVTMADLKEIAKNVFEDHDLADYWLDYIGHFVGMAVHDPGPYDRPFEKGVVFNVEPLIEDKEKNFHMRLEDTIIVTENGSENVTDLTPVEVDEIYKMIKEKGLWEK